MEDFKEKIVLNVGGVRYETYSNTLRAFPGTKLCSLTEPHAPSIYDYNPTTKEFFFDRSGEIFSYVLNYYRTKHLHCPIDICRSVLEEELAFWEINVTHLAFCCWLKLNNRKVQPEELHIWDENDQADDRCLIVQTERMNFSWRTRWQPKIWSVFEKPFSSFTAKCLAIVSLLFIIGIVIIFCEETKAQFEFFTANFTFNGHSEVARNYHEPHYHQPASLLHLELFCVLWFSFEFSVRLCVCPDKKKFFQNPLNVVDFLSLFPVYIELFVDGHIQKMPSVGLWLGFIRVVYLLKLLKLSKLIETPLTLRVLFYTLKSILREICILLMILAFETLFFGALFFYGELLCSNPSYTGELHITDIFVCFWWALITLTTVGYGDIIPLTTVGQVTAALAAVFGMLTIIIPIPIFLVKFKSYYAVAVFKQKLKS
ncbi:potassium voltage-gated channel subfamily C member 1-like [Nothoprocta perdicaria]|uniref:potassium voltage-gated channel subfamily C member 1-like n=1 Tax=Nothoprocta perdicaria TaxID=30464 RepID=UPI000E1C0D0D|nr:potassium voltage-gated channel subfamily C member 1-like [Nothoprocta perdicaria]XP_025888975.1 potassium voltage-gated channel subfamily C member 1-like [Nothoprocta perdicaria]XP_025888976.1 potassium voltage-gated channel subfamily C member 1-like [Nothoprocta perdicaria]